MKGWQISALLNLLSITARVETLSPEDDLCILLMTEPLGQMDIVPGAMIILCFLTLCCFLAGRRHKLITDSFAVHLLAPLWSRTSE